MIYEGSKDNEYTVHFNVPPDILISKLIDWLIENVYLKSNLKKKNSSKADNVHHELT